MSRFWPEPLKHEPWAEAYELAVLEKDSSKLASRIQTAKTEIALRISELSEMPTLSGKRNELDSINRAIQVLRRLAEHAPLRKTAV